MRGESGATLIGMSIDSARLLFPSFQGYAVRMDISGGNMSTFSKDEIAKELLRCGGAHAPTHYVFGPNDEMEVNPSPQ